MKKTMLLELVRRPSGRRATFGELFINGKLHCRTIEDVERKVKVFGQTAIPRGRYEIKLRAEGGFDARYHKKYGGIFHRGMLHVTNVPGFEYILIHIGNTPEDTHGCILVGETAFETTNFLASSEAAYLKLYPIVRDALLRNEKVEILVR